MIALFVAAARAAPLWVLAEARSDQPLVDMRMMRIPTVWTVNLVALLFGMGMYSMFAFLPQFLQTPEFTGYGFGLSVTESGPAAPPPDRRDLRRRRLLGPPGRAVRLQGRPRRRRDPDRSRHPRAHPAARQHLGRGRRDHRPRSRLRPGLRRHVEPRRGRRPAVPDRCRERHERQHPHRRRCPRRRRHRQCGHRQPATRRAPARVRLHQRLRRSWWSPRPSLPSSPSSCR